MLIIIGYKTTDSSSWFSLYLSAYIGYYMIVFKKILLIPTSYLMLKIYSCSAISDSNLIIILDLDCDSNIHIILKVFGTIMYIAIILFSILISYFYNDETPNSSLPWALCNIRIEVSRVLRCILCSTILATNLHYKSSLLCLFVLLANDSFALYCNIYYTSYLYDIVQSIEIINTANTIIYSIYCLILTVFFI